MKTIKLCGVLLHFPYDPYPQQLSIAQVAIRAITRLQNGAVEIPTGCGKTMALLCSAMGFQVEQRYKLLELMSNDDTIWEMSSIQDQSHLLDVSMSYDDTKPNAHHQAATNNQLHPVNAASDIPKTTTATDASATASAVPKCASSSWDFPNSSALDDDDDFQSLPRRRSAHTPKRPRMDCGDGACCSTPCGSGGGFGFGAGGDALASSESSPAPTSCGRPLQDIEDTATPAGDRKLKTPPRSSFDGDETLKPADKAGVVGKESEFSPDSKPEVVDLVSSEESNDSTISWEDADCSRSTTFRAPEEVLSQSFYNSTQDGEDGEEAAWGPYGPRISREAMRTALRGRRREPMPGGEYGPTRHLTVPRAQAPLRIPKIYYASRTHLQLEQVASEIRRTHYCDARVVVLSSREFTCINDGAFRCKKYSNRTEMCRELLNDVPDSNMSWSEAKNITHMDEISSKASCYFFRNSKLYATHNAMESINVGPVVDVNVLVRAGKRHKFCPYFSARNLVSTADVILCPVNYLIDPLIRKSMNMELKGEIVVIDEAHMLDDLCRETASLILPIGDLKECLKDCSSLVDREQLPAAHKTMVVLLEALSTWIETCSKKALSFGYNKEREFSLSSANLIASFEQAHINQGVISNFMEGLSEASRHKTEILATAPKAAAFFKVISNKTESVSERLALIMNLVFKHPEDYVGSVTYTNKHNADTSFNSRKEQEWAIKLTCQNAGLIFQMLSSVTRSIIFSSATISPLPAFAGELGIQVQNITVRGHVIPPAQTWIGSLGRSANGHELYGRYSNTKSVEYMDEIGKIVLDICVRVPYGVLVFVTAYWTLENMIQRWKDTGIWTSIGEHKRPFSETRRSRDFNEVLRCFYGAVEEAQEALNSGLVSVGSGCTGPLLVAVMRGKVSEGFNFADDKTRAIVTVGIPYPNIHEDTIRWKREYNKVHALKRPLQDAEGWYNTQAFRALSQSLGRGLRHRQDWCLLLLLDARFQQAKFAQKLPQWMYERMVSYHQYAGMLNSVEDYIRRMKSEFDS